MAAGDEENAAPPAHGFTLQPRFALRPTKRTGRNAHTLLRLSCCGSSSSGGEHKGAEQEDAEAAPPTWWKSRVKIKGVKMPPP